MPPTSSTSYAGQRAFPFRITHILTDRGSCFTADAFEEACAELKVPHRQTKADTPQTNGMVDRFNGRVASDVLGINVAGYGDLEILLTSFNRAYSQRRQRVIHGLAPLHKVAERIKLDDRRESKLYKPPADQNDLLDEVDRILC